VEVRADRVRLRRRIPLEEAPREQAGHPRREGGRPRFPERFLLVGRRAMLRLLTSAPGRRSRGADSAGLPGLRARTTSTGRPSRTWNSSTTANWPPRNTSTSTRRRPIFAPRTSISHGCEIHARSASPFRRPKRRPSTSTPATSPTSPTASS